MTYPITYRWTIYTLVDPRDGEIRYVGCTRYALIARLHGHLSSNTPYYSEKVKWINELKALGLRPLIYEICETTDVTEYWDLELTWVRRLTLAGCQLLNASPRELRITGRKLLPREPWVSPYTLWPPVKLPGLPQWEMLGQRVVRRIRYEEARA